jgi:hypothetical protein
MRRPKMIPPINHVNPNPRIVALMDYALDQITTTLYHKEKYPQWLEWAAGWKKGERLPAKCVRVARIYLDERHGNPVKHCLGQLCWAAKEACYNLPNSGWLVIRYIADAMVAFGIAFPDSSVNLLPPPSFDGEAEPMRHLLP